MALPPQHIQDDEASDSLMCVDPTFTCPNCGGKVVYRGSKVCFPCQNGGSQLSDMLKGYQAKKPKEVKATQAEIMEARGKAGGNLPPLK